jgi:ribose/xylose/arabinose/galactoside ABC-type transport system permease subunit
MIEENTKGKLFLRNTLNFLKGQIILLVLILLVIIFGLLSPVFFTPNNLANIGRQVSQVAIVSCGMTMLIIGGGIDLSVASTFGLSGLVAAITINASGSWLLGVIAGLAIGLFFGFLNGIITAKGKIPAFLTTLATMGIIRGISMTITKTRDVSIASPRYWKLFGDGTLLRIPSQIIWVVVIVAITWFVLRKTILGRSTYAVGGNIEAAHFSGINVDRVTIYLFMIVGFLAALAGIILSSQMHASRPNAGTGLELNAIAATILGGTSLFGGKGTIKGALIGSLIMAVLNNGLLLMGFSTYIQMIITGCVIILAVLFVSGRKRS